MGFTVEDDIHGTQVDQGTGPNLKAHDVDGFRFPVVRFVVAFARQRVFAARQILTEVSLMVGADEEPFAILHTQEPESWKLNLIYLPRKKIIRIVAKISGEILIGSCYAADDIGLIGCLSQAWNPTHREEHDDHENSCLLQNINLPFCLILFLISAFFYTYNITSSVSPGHKGIHWRSDFAIHGTCRETWSANLGCAINCLLLLEEKSLILVLYYTVPVSYP